MNEQTPALERVSEHFLLEPRMNAASATPQPPHICVVPAMAGTTQLNPSKFSKATKNQ